MKPDIITKLAQELGEPIGFERQIVYIMVELRKLIELNGDGAKYPALKLHCDWVAHPILQGQGMSSNFSTSGPPNSLTQIAFIEKPSLRFYCNQLSEEI